MHLTAEMENDGPPQELPALAAAPLRAPRQVLKHFSPPQAGYYWPGRLMGVLTSMAQWRYNEHLLLLKKCGSGSGSGTIFSSFFFCGPSCGRVSWKRRSGAGCLYIDPRITGSFSLMSESTKVFKFLMSPCFYHAIT